MLTLFIRDRALYEAIIAQFLANGINIDNEGKTPDDLLSKLFS
jgi:hypothetical protein